MPLAAKSRRRKPRIFLVFARPKGQELGSDRLVAAFLDEADCYALETRNRDLMIEWEERIVTNDHAEIIGAGDPLILTYDAVTTLEGPDGYLYDELDSGAEPIAVMTESMATPAVLADHFTLRVNVGDINLDGIGALES